MNFPLKLSLIFIYSPFCFRNTWKLISYFFCLLICFHTLQDQYLSFTLFTQKFTQLQYFFVGARKFEKSYAILLRKLLCNNMGGGVGVFNWSITVYLILQKYLSIVFTSFVFTFSRLVRMVGNLLFLSTGFQMRLSPLTLS